MSDVLLHNYILHDGITPLTNLDLKVVCNPGLKIKRVIDKGIKTLSEYLGSEGELIARKTWQEDLENKILTKTFDILNSEGDVVESKSIEISLTGTEWSGRKRKQRITIFDDLKDRAEKYGAKQYIETLYSFFRLELDDFYETGSDIFKNKITEVLSIDSESLPTGNSEESQYKNLIIGIQTILNTVLGEDGYKVGETIIYQMS